MTQWGRKEKYSWPSRRPLGMIGAFFASVLAIILVMFYQYRQWTPLQQYWLPKYFKTSFMAGLGMKASEYRTVEVETRGKGKDAKFVHFIALVPVVPLEGPVQPGALPFDIPDEYKRRGFRLVLEPKTEHFNALLQQTIRHEIYQDQTFMGFMLWPLIAGACVFVVGLAFGIPRDLKARRIRKYGRRTKGPELVTAATFNRKNSSDGIGFKTNERRTLVEFLLGRTGNVVRIPQDKESSHLMAIGDTGVGKSSLVRQILIQVGERGETAIVYDPALEYTPQFYDPARGDVILNPLDQRMPYWSPCAEVQHEAEAESLAAALFKDDSRSNPFFVTVPRQIFAHLLAEDPKRTPQELLAILRDEQELTKRLKGTEFAAAIHPEAGQQRGGMMATLNMVGNALKLLPRRDEAQTSWTASAWSKQRQGWLFITSPPEFRERLRPLISMWLDMLILRLMNQGKPGVRPVWFILDELQSLHVLPQLHTAITESRKAKNPVVLGFQGRSQVEELYGRKAEVMLSQAATKIFLRTAEAHSAKWISETIGKVEMERLRESHTQGQFPNKRESTSNQAEAAPEPLVMDAEIMGLPDLHGYLKFGNFVVRLSFDYVDIPNRQPAFLERKLTPQAAQPAAPADSRGVHASASEPNSVPARPRQPETNGVSKPEKQAAEQDDAAAKSEHEKTPYFD
jgi:type IV secretory pathway TraG/TraD family ATPase VirD4